MLYYWNIGQMYTDCDVRRKWERTVCHVLAGKIGRNDTNFCFSNSCQSGDEGPKWTVRFPDGSPLQDHPAANAAMVPAAKASPASFRTVKRSSSHHVAIRTLTTKLS